MHLSKSAPLRRWQTPQGVSLYAKNGHILPFVRFQGGRMELAEEAQDVLWASVPKEERF